MAAVVLPPVRRVGLPQGCHPVLINALKGMTSASSDYSAVTKTANIFIFRQRVIYVQFVISVLEPTNSGDNCVHEGHAGLGNSKDR